MTFKGYKVYPFKKFDEVQKSLPNSKKYALNINYIQICKVCYLQICKNTVGGLNIKFVRLCKDIVSTRPLLCRSSSKVPIGKHHCRVPFKWYENISRSS